MNDLSEQSHNFKATSDDWEDIGVLDWIMLCRALTKMSIIYEEPYGYSVFSGLKMCGTSWNKRSEEVPCCCDICAKSEFFNLTFFCSMDLNLLSRIKAEA